MVRPAVGYADCGALSGCPERPWPKTSLIGGRRLSVWFAGTWWMCDVLERLEVWWLKCRLTGAGFCRPVKLWPRGADWMTLSLANCLCEGATIDRPGGALFLRDMPGVLAAKPAAASLSLSDGPSPLADC